MVRAADVATAVSLATIAWASASVAQAEPPLRVSWEAPRDCPSQADVVSEIHRRLGGPPATGRNPLRVTARVERRADGLYHAQLSTDAGGVAGDKELDDASCVAVADAAALVIALTFDPDAVAATNAPPREARQPPPPAAPVAALPPDRPAPSLTARRDAVAVGGGVHAAAGAALGALPGVAFGLTVGGTLLVDRFRGELAGAWYPTRSDKLADSDAGGDFQLLCGSASGGYALLVRPVEIAPAVGLEVGRISGAGTGVLDAGEGSGVWLAPFAAVRGFVPIVAPLGLRAELGLAVPIFRNRFVLENVGSEGTTVQVHRASAVVGRAAVGAELRF